MAASLLWSARSLLRPAATMEVATCERIGKADMLWASSRRALMLLATLLLVSALAFLVPYMTEGDPARAILLSRMGSDQGIDPAALQQLRHELGLDRSMAVQYASWLWDALRGDLGRSYVNHMPVFGQIARATTVSLLLALSALGTALVVALPLGTLAAMRPGSRLDSALTLLIQVFVATPEYWLAPVAIFVFALSFHLLPSAGWNGPSSIVLPAFVLTLRPLAYFAQVTRAAMGDVLQSPFITAARSRGLSWGETVVRHGLRNGTMPVITLFALWLAGLLGGSVVVEVIFSVPGMGRLIYEALVNKDLPMLQGAFVCIVGLSVLINTAADFGYVLLNPVLRPGRGR